MKTFIVATCAAILAGGAVYFTTSTGTSSGTVELRQSHDQQSSKALDNEKDILERYIPDSEDVEKQSPENKHTTKNTASDKNEPSTNTDLVGGNRPVATSPKKRPEAAPDDPAKLRVRTVFQQAKKIQQLDLRDRAYLDLVDYATDRGLFDDAERAAKLIRQIELRDTARSRIAMGLARYGLPKQAFALIEEVEVDELRDVMRLQVIEALLGMDQRR